MEETQHFRAFIAIKIPQPILAGIDRLQRHLEHQPGAQAVRWVRLEHIHLTLEFLGNVDATRQAELIAAVDAACAGFAPFLLRAEGLGCFPALLKPNVLWIGIAGALEPLMKLQAAIHAHASGFGDNNETRAFHPHLTIGRIKRDAFRQARRVGEMVKDNPSGSLGEWTARAVSVMRSELTPKGPVYTELASLTLGG